MSTKTADWMIIACVLCFLPGCATEVEQAEDLFQLAHTASAEGDTEAAIGYLTQSIEKNPTAYAYLERGKLRGQSGDAEGAIDDGRKGLELEPDSGDLKWLIDECKKPAGSRFENRNAEPPSFYK